MAVKPVKAERAPAQPQSNKRPPAFVCRCRKFETDKYGNRRPTDFYQHIGVAWSQTFTNRKTGEVTEGFAVKIEGTPPSWDGSFVILPKRENDGEMVEQE